MPARNVSQADLDELLRGDVPVLVQFTAPWCGPCRQVAPYVEQIAQHYEGRLVVAKINIDTNQSFASHHGVRAIPAFLVFKDGKVVDRLLGPSRSQLDAIALRWALKEHTASRPNPTAQYAGRWKP